MKKLIELMIPVKSFAAMLFAGFVCLYMAGGVFVATFIDGDFSYSITFLHLIFGIGFTMAISLLWGVAFSNTVIKKWSFAKREFIFVVLLAALAAGGMLKIKWFFASEWTPLLLVVAGAILGFVIVLSLVSEWYFQKTSIRYTSMLKAYQADNL